MPHIRARIALFVVVLAAAAVSPSRSALAGPWSVGKGEWFSGFEGSVFSASSLYDSTGARRLAGLTVEQRSLTSYTELGWKKRISLVLGVPAMSVTHRDAPRGIEATSAGLQDFLGGFRFNLANGRAALALQTDWTAPLGYNRTLDSLGHQLGSGVSYRDTAAFALGAGRTYRQVVDHSGDGLQSLGASLQLGTGLFGRAFLQGSVGYRYNYYSIGKRKKEIADVFDFGPDTANVSRPGKSDTTITIQQVVRFSPGRGLWSDQLVTSADLGLWISRSLLLGGRFRGQTTLSHGPLVPDITQYLAGPVLVFRVDDGLDMTVGSWSTPSGKNALHFDQVYVGLAFRKTKLNRLQGFTGNQQNP